MYDKGMPVVYDKHKMLHFEKILKVSCIKLPQFIED